MRGASDIPPYIMDDVANQDHFALPSIPQPLLPLPETATTGLNKAFNTSFDSSTKKGPLTASMPSHIWVDKPCLPEPADHPVKSHEYRFPAK